MHVSTRSTFILMAAVFCGMLLTACEPMTFGQPKDPVYFTLGVEQDGQKIPVNGHTVRIRRAPFRLVFAFQEMSSMLVHASPTPEKAQALQAGRAVNDLFMYNANVSEDLFNPHRTLYFGDDSYHNWLFLGEKIHRFDQGAVHKLRDKGFLCMRTVEKLTQVSGGEVVRTLPMENYPYDRLYLSFVQTQRVAGSEQHHELQRDWLVVEFVDADPAAPVSAASAR